MRTGAEMLFLMGRLETIKMVLILADANVGWRWRRDALKRYAGVVWLVLFVGLSVTMLFDPVVERAANRTGYVIAHLHGGIWRTDEEALSNILACWRNVWLPVYVPWLGVWLAGLAGVSLLPGRIRAAQNDPLHQGTKPPEEAAKEASDAPEEMLNEMRRRQTDAE